ncbi:FliH/SctL family protein [Dendrosporobacter sp. 1207_IL3150]|uniref:FliH/SctL family protein n=1 Tax=Dendrosporobacter sp. 1207_IL3150 TaxID=3084054 RepID=UPI002FDB11BF
MSKILKSVSMRESPRIINSGTIAIETKRNNDDSCVEAERLLKEAHEQAKTIIADAENQSETIITDAKAELEELRNQAQNAGFEQGYSDGYVKGKEAALADSLKTLLEAVEKSEQIMSMTDQEMRDSVLDAERHILEIALAVARKILVREIDENPMVVLPIVKNALEKVRDQDQIVIKVNPEDYDLLLQARRDLQVIVGREHSLTIANDQTIEIGSCIIESSNGTVDARISTQFEVLAKTLQEVTQ